MSLPEALGELLPALFSFCRPPTARGSRPPSSPDVTSLCFPGHISDFLPPSFIYWDPRGLSEPTGTIQSASHLEVSATAPVKHRSPWQVTDPWDSSTDSCRALLLPPLTIMPMHYFRKGCITLLHPWLMTFNRFEFYKGGLSKVWKDPEGGRPYEDAELGVMRLHAEEPETSGSSRRRVPGPGSPSEVSLPPPGRDPVCTFMWDFSSSEQGLVIVRKETDWSDTELTERKLERSCSQTEQCRSPGPPASPGCPCSS